MHTTLKISLSFSTSHMQECFPTSSISSYRYPCLRRWDYRLLLPSSTCKSTLQQSRSLCSEEIKDLQWTDVDTPELLQLLASEDIQLFDVREPEELEETGTIPRAVNLPRMLLTCSTTHKYDPFLSIQFPWYLYYVTLEITTDLLVC